MIKNNNRSHWFGASDSAIIMGNWDTKSFQDWWAIKLGFQSSSYKTWIMECGNIMEIPIIHEIEKIENRKIKLGKKPYYIRKLRLRVNYDGIGKNDIVEIKTTGKCVKTVPKNYWYQCQVEMFLKKKKYNSIYFYKMDDVDYLSPYFATIDKTRLVRFVVEYDEQFINEKYLPRLKVLASRLINKEYPTVEEMKALGALR